MAKRLALDNSYRPIATKGEKNTNYFSVQDFIDTYPNFMIYKMVENLAERTYTDYENAHKYMCKFIEEWYSNTLVRYDVKVIKTYITWMLERLQPSTVNIRILYLKVYLKFLEEEGYVKDSINHRIKKVKEVSKMTKSNLLI